MALPRESEHIFIDVVIPAFNSETSIERCIEAINKNQSSKLTLNPIVVNNNSTDRTAQLVKSLGVKVVNCSKQGPAAARNFGFELTQSEFIAFIDSDILLTEHWFEELLSCFDSPVIGAAQGPIIPAPRISFTDNYRYYERESYTEGTFLLTHLSSSQLPSIDSAAFITRRSVFKHLNGFDENLRVLEDSNFTTRLLYSGYSLMTKKSAIANKLDRRGTWGILKRNFIFGTGLMNRTIHYEQTKMRSLFVWYMRENPFARFKAPHMGFYLFHLLSKVTFKLGCLWGLLRFMGTKKNDLRWGPAKVNLLIKRIVFPSTGEEYDFSRSVRFCLNEESLTVYGSDKMGRVLFSDPETLNIFRRIIEGEEIVNPRPDIKRIIEELCQKRILTKVN